MRNWPPKERLSAPDMLCFIVLNLVCRLNFAEPKKTRLKIKIILYDQFGFCKSVELSVSSVFAVASVVVESWFRMCSGSAPRS